MRELVNIAFSFVFSMSTESGKRLFVFISIGPSGLQLEHPLSGRMNQPACAVATAGRLSRYQKEPVPDGGNHGLGLALIQYLFLEQIHDVVSQHQQLKPCLTGRHPQGSRAIDNITHRVSHWFDQCD